MTVVIVGGTKACLRTGKPDFPAVLGGCDCCPPQAQVVGKPVLAGIRRQIVFAKVRTSAVAGLDGTRSGSDPQWLWFRFAFGATFRRANFRLVRTLQEEQQLVQAISSNFRYSGVKFIYGALLDPPTTGARRVPDLRSPTCELQTTGFTRRTCPL